MRGVCVQSLVGELRFPTCHTVGQNHAIQAIITPHNVAKKKKKSPDYYRSIAQLFLLKISATKQRTISKNCVLKNQKANKLIFINKNLSLKVNFIKGKLLQ